MVEKHGTWPANARVDVDYSKGKPKISFDYPDNGDSAKKQAKKQNRLGPHTFILVIILACFLVCTASGGVQYVSSPEECNFSEVSYESNKTIIDHMTGNESSFYYKAISGYNITCGNETYKIKFNNFDSMEMSAGFHNNDYDSKEQLWFVSLWILLPIILFFIINGLLTIYLIKQKWYQKWLPKHQAEGWIKNIKNKKYIKFTEEDVENNMVEIPLFNNVELDYKAEGDFSDKLERIKIREHQYYKYKKGKVGKKKIDLYKWYARFYFKTRPKKGSLEVIFQ